MSAQAAAAHSALGAECATAAGEAYAMSIIDLGQINESIHHEALYVALATGRTPAIAGGRAPAADV